MKGRRESPLAAVVRAFLSVLALSAVAAPARAADPPSQGLPDIVARERPTTRTFYGWQILATGEVGGVVAATATVLAESPMKTVPSAVGFLAGMPLYVLGGPATHWTHGAFNKGLISFAGNVVLPVVGGLVGQTVRCAPSDAPADCGSRGFFTGFAIALVTVPIADAFVLGWEDIPDDDPAPSDGAPAPPNGASTSSAAQHQRVARFTMTPAWSVGPKGQLAVGVAGRF
jgi:hypothetical protein